MNMSARTARPTLKHLCPYPLQKQLNAKNAEVVKLNGTLEGLLLVIQESISDSSESNSDSSEENSER